MELASTILSTAAFAGLAGAGLTQVITWWRERGRDIGTARYAAIRLAVLLEAYAIDCADGIAGWEAFRSSGESIGNDLTKIPTLPEYPVEDGWKVLRPDLLERALTLRNQVVVSRQSVRNIADVEGWGSTVEDHLAGHVGVCGLCSWILAKDMRHAYTLQPFDLTRTSWDIEPILRRWHDEIVTTAAITSG